MILDRFIESAFLDSEKYLEDTAEERDCIDRELDTLLRDINNGQKVGGLRRG